MREQVAAPIPQVIRVCSCEFALSENKTPFAVFL